MNKLKFLSGKQLGFLLLFFGIPQSSKGFHSLASLADLKYHIYPVDNTSINDCPIFKSAKHHIS